MMVSLGITPRRFPVHVEHRRLVQLDVLQVVSGDQIGEPTGSEFAVRRVETHHRRLAEVSRRSFDLAISTSAPPLGMVAIDLRLALHNRQRRPQSEPHALAFNFLLDGVESAGEVLGGRLKIALKSLPSSVDGDRKSGGWGKSVE